MKTVAQGPHVITALFEAELCRYLGSPFAVAVDNQSNALFLCLIREGVKGMTVRIPSHTYPSVPAEIIMAGGKVEFLKSSRFLTGPYDLEPTRVVDAALRFTADMFQPGKLMCVSMTGQHKILKLGKGGAILCDSEDDYEWFKRARNSGRGEVSYHDDTFTMIGRNCYMHPTVAALGLQLMGQFYNLDGSKKHIPDLSLPYPDLSLPKHTAYK